MIRILATATVIFLVTLLVPVSNGFAQDLGAPDTLYLIPSQLEAGGNDSSFTIEAWIFNDVDGVELQFAFGWDSELITLDSAKKSPLAASNDIMTLFYDQNLATSNVNNRAIYASFDFMWSPMPPSPDPKLIATYFFSVADWTRQSEIKIDTLAWDDATEMIFVIQSGEMYMPVWSGGDQPLIIRDVDSDNDGIKAENDNCPLAYNPGQEDSNSDGVGDVCAIDHGAPDTLYLIPSELEEGGNDSSFILEAWMFNDVDTVYPQLGFEWDSELITLDSARVTRPPGALWIGTILYDNNIGTSNLNNRAVFAAYDFMCGPAFPSQNRKLFATYYFSVSDWTNQSEMAIDTMQWDDGTKMLFATCGETYVPVWSGGDQPIVVQDVNPTEDCCGLYTSGFTGNIDCDPDGNRDLRDLIRLIIRVYFDKTELCCEANGNVNGDIEGEIDLSDIFALIDHVYINKEETTACQ